MAMRNQSPDDLLAQRGAALARLYQSVGASRWGLLLSQFIAAVRQSVERRKPDARAETSIDKLLDSLHAYDLALAAACRLGLESAWNDFVASYRSILYDAARAMARDEARGRELADSLADLYGLEIRAGNRRSLLQYFDGRSSLSTWLGAVLARRFVNNGRQERRTSSIEDCSPASLPQAEPGRSARSGPHPLPVAIPRCARNGGASAHAARAAAAWLLLEDHDTQADWPANGRARIDLLGLCW